MSQLPCDTASASEEHQVSVMGIFSEELAMLCVIFIKMHTSTLF
jgi:hypothetical protein